MLYKTGEVAAGRTVCDYCSRRATIIDEKTGRSYCDACYRSNEKQASQLPLRSIRSKSDIPTGD